MRSIRTSILTAIAAASIAASPTAGFAQSNDFNDRRIDVHNHTNMSIFKVYASRPDEDSWEEDMLGDEIIASGGRQRFNIDDGTSACIFDVKVVFRNDESRERRRVNVCRATILDVWAEGIRIGTD